MMRAARRRLRRNVFWSTVRLGLLAICVGWAWLVVEVGSAAIDLMHSAPRSQMATRAERV